MEVYAPTPDLPPATLRETQAHRAKPGTAHGRQSIDRRLSIARGFVRAVIGGERKGFLQRRGLRCVRARARSKTAQRPADLDAALDAPEPHKGEHRRADEHVEDGEEVGEASRRGEQGLGDV